MDESGVLDYDLLPTSSRNAPLAQSGLIAALLFLIDSIISLNASLMQTYTVGSWTTCCSQP